MKKGFYKILIGIISIFIITLNSFAADFVQTSNPQSTASLGADEILTGNEQNKAITDIAKIIVDIGNLKNYVDQSLVSIWTNEDTQISYNDKDVYFKNNLQVVDDIKANGLIIPEGAFKDNTITTTEVVNGQIKKEDLDVSIFNSLTTLYKLNGTTGYYNKGKVGVNVSNPDEMLTIDGNVKIDTNGKGIIFPDGTIQTTGNVNSNSNMKLTGNQEITELKKFNKAITLQDGTKLRGISNDQTMGKGGIYCGKEGDTCRFAGTKRIWYGTNLVGWTSKIDSSGAVKCETNSFGGVDPAYLYNKSCFISEVDTDISPSKFVVKQYIDKNVKGDVIKKATCGNDNGEEKKLVKETTQTTNQTIDTKKEQTTYNYPSWTTVRTSSRGGPYYSNGQMYVSSTDRGGMKQLNTVIGSYSGTDYVGKFGVKYEGTIDTNDCRGSGESYRFYKDDNNQIQLYTRNSRKSGRSYDCRGSCNNKNFGGHTTNWSCLSSSCGASTWAGLQIISNGKRWNYIYNLNGYGSGEYKFEYDVDLQAKTWHLVLKNLSGTVLVDKNLTLPNPTNGLDITKLQGDFKPRNHVAKTCGRTTYMRGKYGYMGGTKIVTTTTKIYKIDNFTKTCNDGTPESNNTCNYLDGTSAGCNVGDTITKPLDNITWNCKLDTETTKCGFYAEEKKVDLGPSKEEIFNTKIKRGLISYYNFYNGTTQDKITGIDLGKHGTSIVTDHENKSNKAIHLGYNTTDYINVNHNSLSNLNDFTFSFVAKRVGTNNDGYTLLNAVASTDDDIWIFDRISGNYTRIMINNQEIRFNNIHTGFSQDKIWHLINIVREGGTYRLYSDGNLIGTKNGYSGSIRNLKAAQIGQESDRNGSMGNFDKNQTFNGDLSIFTIHNRALSQDEINQFNNYRTISSLD